MVLTAAQAFKVGFLKKCAEDGLTIEETKLRVKKAIALKKASPVMTKEANPLAYLLGLASSGIGSAASGIARAVPQVLSTGLAAGVGLPIAGGAAAGYTAAKLSSPGDNPVENAKREEIMGEYERLADEARRRTRLKKLQAMTGRRVIALTPKEEPQPDLAQIV